MRTALFFLSGLLLLGAARLLAHLFSEAAPSATTVLAGVFSLMWLAATGYNMWAGVHHAGYSWAEEAPIFLFLFLVPLAAAWFIGLRPQ